MVLFDLLVKLIKFLLDIDECAGQHGCSQICSNTQGSYRCTCKEGFKLQLTDRRTCIGKFVLCYLVNYNPDCYASLLFGVLHGSVVKCLTSNSEVLDSSCTGSSRFFV